MLSNPESPPAGSMKASAPQGPRRRPRAQGGGRASRWRPETGRPGGRPRLSRGPEGRRQPRGCDVRLPPDRVSFATRNLVPVGPSHRPAPSPAPCWEPHGRRFADRDLGRLKPCGSFGDKLPPDPSSPERPPVHLTAPFQLILWPTGGGRGTWATRAGASLRAGTRDTQSRRLARTGRCPLSP